MSKQEVQKVSRIKVKKKQWYKIVAPKTFAQKELGESYLASPESALGRMLKINLRELSGNIKDQNVYVEFKITPGPGTSLQTEVVGYQLTTSAIKRMVKKNINRLDDYFTAVTKDGKKVLFKTLLTTHFKTQRSIQGALRRGFQQLLLEEAAKSTFEALVTLLVSHKVEQAAKKSLSRIYPVRDAVVRIFQFLEAGATPPELPAAPVVEAAAPEQAEAGEPTSEEVAA